MRVRLFLLAPLLILLNANCASMGRGASEQVVFVQTTPEGASIFDHGKDLGQSPRFVKIRRTRKPEIEITDGNSRITVPLKPHYRWKESFFSNFVFYIGAPIGWITDLIDGNAWEAESPAPIAVKLNPQDLADSRKAKPPENFAIAPPLSDQIALSDEGGQEIESKLRRSRNGVHVLGYHETLPTFLSNGYDFDGALTDDERGSLYYNLNAQHVFESTIEPENDHLKLKVIDHDIFNQTRTPAFDLQLDPSTNLDWVYTSNAWWSRLLFNTVTVDYVSSSIEITRGQRQYVLHDADRTAWAEVALKYLSALNITSLPPRRAGRASRLVFNLVPVLRVSRKNVRAEGLSPDVANFAAASSSGTDEGTSEEYTRWLLSTGYGPELGWQISRHYFYLNVVPVFYWSEISWSTQTRHRSVTNTGVQIATELGYIFYLTPSWNLKLFSRSQNESAAGWGEALGSRLPDSQLPTSASAIMSGLSFGYRFEPGARAHQE